VLYLVFSTQCLLAASVASVVVSIGIRVVHLLPAAVGLGWVATIGRFPVSPGCLPLRIFCMLPALVMPTWTSRICFLARTLPVPFRVLRTHLLISSARPSPTVFLDDP